ncbi:ABC transporter permease subunit [Legionella londiniensis]|uniref:sn-glycerol-3-phosphate transport system permease protein UgpA n=1 Tax=Legionella londiniensis TaxID=45068 RepID=A0A0W0VNK6_9GAMM|nr:ABC transporter permease subunit [Legionella londiniensis]KTD21635.1 sn-glycerol-3-phosphate transmembrane ABC transporter [Legionella londiniensis]STX93406.1 sn-glycerol 3-phosphate transport system permease protein [Legionella londiniensis]
MAKYTQHSKIAFVLIAPQVFITFLFFIWPALSAVWQSLFYSDAFGLHSRFAGFGNFIDLFSTPEYRHAFMITCVLSFFVTIFTLSFGLGMAVLVNALQRGQKVYKTMLIWPYAVAPAIAAILWRFLFHPTLGWISGLLHWCGLEFNYLVHPYQALLVIIIAASWQQFSYNFLFYFAALKLIPRPLIEAAIIDGASSWQRFWQIVFPLLSPTTFFLLVMNLIYSFFDTFGIIQVLTNGGPGQSTTTLIYKVYQDGFVGMDPGMSSAQSVIMMVIVVGLTLLQFKYLEKKVHY